MKLMTLMEDGEDFECDLLWTTGCKQVGYCRHALRENTIRNSCRLMDRRLIMSG